MELCLIAKQCLSKSNKRGKNSVQTSLKKRISLLRIFYFLSDFASQFKLSPVGCQTDGEKEIALHFQKASTKMIRILNHFYEDVEKYKETGSFENAELNGNQ